MFRRLPYASAAPPGEFPLPVVQAGFFALAFGIALAHLFIVLASFGLPIHSAVRKTSLCFVQTIYAWAALDVFALAVLSTTSQIPMFTEIVIGDAFDSINDLLAKLNYDFLVEHVLYRAEVGVLPGWYFILVVALISVPISTIVLRAHFQLALKLDNEMETTAAESSELESAGVHVELADRSQDLHARFDPQSASALHVRI